MSVPEPQSFEYRIGNRQKFAVKVFIGFVALSVVVALIGKDPVWPKFMTLTAVIVMIFVAIVLGLTRRKLKLENKRAKTVGPAWKRSDLIREISRENGHFLIRYLLTLGRHIYIKQLLLIMLPVILATILMQFEFLSRLSPSIEYMSEISNDILDKILFSPFNVTSGIKQSVVRLIFLLSFIGTLILYTYQYSKNTKYIQTIFNNFSKNLNKIDSIKKLYLLNIIYEYFSNSYFIIYIFF